MGKIDAAPPPADLWDALTEWDNARNQIDQHRGIIAKLDARKRELERHALTLMEPGPRVYQCGGRHFAVAGGQVIAIEVVDAIGLRFPDAPRYRPLPDADNAEFDAAVRDFTPGRVADTAPDHAVSLGPVS